MRPAIGGFTSFREGNMKRARRATRGGQARAEGVDTLPVCPTNSYVYIFAGILEGI